MSESAAERWQRELEAWALPLELLEALPDSPYGSPPVLWRRARRLDSGLGSSEVGVAVAGLLPEGGSLLDVGAGTGRLSLPVAATGHPLTAIEPDPAMAEGFRAEAAELGVEARLIEGRWPDAAAEAGDHDVVLCSNVVYDVAEVAPFVGALHRCARVAVVVELTPEHPWTHLAPYFRALHGLELPTGPTDALFADVVREIVGVEPASRRSTRRGVHVFADLQEILAYYGRRLRIPGERADELRRVLDPDIHEEGGWLFVGEREREMVTLWWRGGAA